MIFYLLIICHNNLDSFLKQLSIHGLRPKAKFKIEIKIRINNFIFFLLIQKASHAKSIGIRRKNLHLNF